MKLKDMLGTKYITLTFNKDISYFIGSLLNENIKSIYHYDREFQSMRQTGAPYVIDLAGTNICKDVLITLVNFCNDDRVKLIDTENESRNRILEENARRKLLEYSTTVMPLLSNPNKLVEFVESLDSNLVYCYDSSNQELSIRLMFITMVLRPEIQFDLKGCIHNFFSYVNSIINMNTLQCSSVTYLVGATFYNEKVNKGRVYDPKQGFIPYTEFISRYECIPGELGTTKLASVDKWQIAVRDAVSDLQRFIKHRVTITDFFR